MEAQDHAQKVCNNLFEIGVSPDKFDSISLPDIIGKFGEDVPSLAHKFSCNLPMHTTDAGNSDLKRSPFVFTSTSSASGGPQPCSAISCRIKNVHDLSIFSAMYADRVYVPDPFERFWANPYQGTEHERKEFAKRIIILSRIIPLVRHGIVKFVPDQFYTICADCLQKVESENSQILKPFLSETIEMLKGRFYKEVSYHSTILDGSPTIKIIGPGDLVEHGKTYLVLHETPKGMKRKFRSGHDHLLERGDLDRIKVIPHLVYPIINDLARQNRFGARMQTSYLTQRIIDFDLARSLAERKGKSSAMLSQSFSHNLPIAINTTLEALVQFRISENDSFNLYRDALTKALRDSKEENDKKMAQAFSDIVQPEINKIERLVRVNKKQLMRGVADDIVLGSGFVGISLYSGITSTNIGAIMAALGGIHFARSVYTKIAESIRDPKTAEENSYYFLWKLDKMLKA